MEKATPILVIGMNRSGTKWLSNILCNHPDVIGVQSERARGILETDMFDTMQTKFDLSSPDDYVGFLKLWSYSDFFRITGADEDKFLNLNPRPKSFYELFEILMEDFAKRNRSKHWLQKTDPNLAPAVLDYFTDAKCILIKRDIVSTLRSDLKMFSRRGEEKAIGRAVLSYVLQEKELSKIRKDRQAAFVTYEDLLAEPEQQIQRLCKTIGLSYDPVMLDVSFQRNTSFAQDSERKEIISRNDLRYIKMASALFRSVPAPALKAVVAVRRLGKARGPARFVSGTFGALKDRLPDQQDNPRR